MLKFLASGPKLLAAGAAAMLLVTACASAPAADTEPRFDEAFVRQGPDEDIRDPQAWPPALRTGCDTPTTERPAICIRRSGGDAVRRGEALAADISWRNAPPGASLIVYLEHDAPANVRYLGASGALVATPIAVSGDGAMTFRWNGHDFPCAPADLPTLCRHEAEIGRYRLRAALYDRRNIAIVGWLSRETPVVLAHSPSSAFVVTGTPSLAPLARAMWWAAVNEGMRKNEIDHSGAFAGDADGKAVHVVARRVGLLCGHVPAVPPYVSTVEACVPRSRLIGPAGLLDVPPEEIQVTGRVTVATGAISRQEAILLAQAVADPPYRSRVAFHRQPQGEEAGYRSSRDGDFHEWSRRNPHATTYLSDSVSETIYRPDLGGAWMIVVNELMAGGSVPDEERFADRVLVLVRPDRRACVLETIRYRGGAFSIDVRTARPRC